MKTTIWSFLTMFWLFYIHSSFQFLDKVKIEKNSSIEVSKMDSLSLDPIQFLYQQYHLLYDSLQLRDTIVFIDFSKPSSEKRLWILNAKTKDTILNSFVAHGKYSGAEEALYFSNKLGSKKSSLGFFITAEVYQGSKGLSLKLDGLEAQINNNARKRGIVFHGASYVSEDFLKSNKNVLGRSWGCPAVNQKINKKVIDIIKDNCLLFIYATDNNYLSTSKMIQNVRNNTESQQYL